MKRVYKILNAEWEHIKEKKNEKADLMTHRKEMEAEAMKQRAYELKAKQKRSAGAVKAFKEEQAHKNLLA